MIRVQVSQSDVDQYFKSINSNQGNYKSIKCKLENSLDSERYRGVKKKILLFLKNNLERLLTGTPNELENIISEFDYRNYNSKIYDCKSKSLTNFGKHLETIFDYKSFRRSKKAIGLAKALNCSSCVTCNTQYTLITSQKKGEKLLFHLDHYFPKSRFPYLALSIFNLLPSCASCNMSKSNKYFKIEDHIHPYIEGLHDIASFKTNPDSLLEFLVNPMNNENKIQLSLVPIEKYVQDITVNKKINNYKSEFRILEQYDQFKDVVAEIYLKSKYYNKERRSELKTFLKEQHIYISDDQFYRFIIGNYIDDKDLLKRPLAKFMKDISKEIKLI